MSTMPGKSEGKPHPYLFLMVLVLLLAAALRVLAIRDAPPGPRFDETYEALWAQRVLHGEWPVYFPENFGAEALNAYFQAASFLTFGWSDFALRFPSIAFGLIEVAAVYALGQRAWNRRAGFLAAALCAVSFWALLFSRLGMRLIPLTALVSLGNLMLFKMQAAGCKRQEVGRKVWTWGIAAGVLLGLSVHTYTAARALPVLLLSVLVYLALFHRAELRRQIGYWILVIAIAVLIAAPLTYYLITQPQAEARVEQVSGPLEVLRQGNVMPLIQYTLAALGMFAFRGGTEWLYNLPGRPIFDPLTGLVFFVGIVVALWRWRASRTAFVLIWLGAGLAPVVLSWPPASTSHAILAQPATYLLAGLGLDVVLSWIARGRASRLGSLNRAVPAAVASAILVLNVALTVHDYFFVWNTSDSIRWEHQATVTAMGRYADAHPELHDIAFMGNAVDYHAPWMVVGNSLTSRRMDARWFNPGRALVWNPAGPMTYLIPFRDPDPVTFNQTVRDLFFGVARQTLDEKMPDGHPVFTVYVMPDASALHAQALGTGMLPYDFGGRLTLVGHALKPAEARPGESVRLLTYWRVDRMDTSPLVMFVHLLGADGKLITQEDRLDVALETLHTGDEFLQTHRVVLAGDAQAGTYQIAFGLYSPVTRERVPVAGDDRVQVDLAVK